MDEYKIAALMCLCILGLWVSAFILSWIIQHAWAWVDDSKKSERSWLAGKIPMIIKTKWVHPIYYDADKRDFRGWAKKPSKGYDGRLNHGEDFKFGCEVIPWQIYTVLITSLAPIAILLSIKFYPLAISIVTMTIIAYLARFSRRTKKAFDKHIVDKGLM